MEDVKTAEKNKIIDYAGLSFIGILSLGYLLFVTYFAKLHIYLPFIKAPLFVGEMVFAVCFCLFLLKWLINPKKADIFTYLLLLYFGFVAVKTLLGYFRWGPLSLRHSVLFFYPMFAVFGYSFYRKSFFTPARNLFLVLIFIIVLKFAVFYSYAVLTCFMLMLVLAHSYPKKTVRYGLYVLAVLAVPYQPFFNTSRTFIVANLFALVYTGLGLITIAKIRKIYKIVLDFFFISLIFYWMLHAGSSNEVKSVVGFKELGKTCNSTMELVRVREVEYKEPNGKPGLYDYAKEPNLKVELYNDERDALDQKKISRRVKSLLAGLTGKVKNFFRSIFNKDTVPEPKVEQVEAVTPVVKEPVKTAAVVLVKKVSQASAVIAKPVEKGKKAGAAAITETHKKAEKPQASEESRRVEIFQGFDEYQKAKEASLKIVRERGVKTPYENSTFRFLIWKEVFKQMIANRPVFGFDFGKPFRCHALEILDWGVGEWSRDGWVCIHNSYIDMIYRAGIMGILMIISILVIVFFLVTTSLRNRSLNGILLTGILIDWFVAANFLEILEMPYSAIPMWSLFGLTFAYTFGKKSA